MALPRRATGEIKMATPISRPQPNLQRTTATPSPYALGPVPPQTITTPTPGREMNITSAQEGLAPNASEVLSKPRLDVPSTIPSTMASAPLTRNDVYTRITSNLDNLERAKQQMIQAQQPTEYEDNLKKRISELNQKELTFRSFGQGTGMTREIANRKIKPMQEDLNIERQQLTDQLTALVDLRSAEVEAGKTELLFTQENLSMLESLSELTRPDVIETQVDEITGEIKAVIQDPITGGVEVQTIGRVSPDKSKSIDYLGTYETYDGEFVYGRDKATGKLVKEKLEGSLGKQSEMGELLSPTEAAALGVPFGTTKQEAFGMQAPRSLSSSQERRVDSTIKSFDTHPIVQEYNDVQNKFMTVESIVESGVGGPADLAIVFEFMKGLDPTSVVREAEYDKAAKSGNIFAGAFAKFNGYFKEEGGFLPDNVKEEFKNIIGLTLDAKQAQYENVRQGFAQRINTITGENDGESYLIDYGGVSDDGVDNDLIDDLLIEHPELSEEELYELYLEVQMESGGDFNDVGGDTYSASEIADAIAMAESGGNPNARGISGETGAFQFMPGTWKTVTSQLLGKEIPQTPENERAIAEAKIEQLMEQGYGPKQIAMIWNSSLGGAEKPLVRSGVNKFGAQYNTLAYADKVLQNLRPQL